MVILEDTRNAKTKHANIHAYCEANRITIERCKLYVGDYTIPNDSSISVDTKQDLQEVYSNIIHDNKRFKDECTRAKDAGIRLIILVEQGLIKTLDDVAKWRNPREYWAKKKGLKPPVPSAQLAKAMATMADRYNIEWRFCNKTKTGEALMAILQRDK